MPDVNTFAKSARAHNPLGIIALFIVLIYGMATVTVIHVDKLTKAERDHFVWFLVGFPVLVLMVFVYLVCCHSTKLYGPHEFKNQADWVGLQNPAAPVPPEGATINGAPRRAA